MAENSATLGDLKSKLTAANQLYTEQANRYASLKRQREIAYDNYIGSKPGSPERHELKQKYEALVKEENKVIGALTILLKKIEKLEDRINNFGSGSSTNNAQDNEDTRNPFKPEMQWPDNGQTTQPDIPGQSQYGQSAPQTQPNSLSFNSGGNPSTPPPVLKNSTSGYDDDFRAAAQVLYPGNSSNELPPLVRRDRQPLTQPERMYPVTGYDEDIYEPWPDDVIETAIKRYPDFRKKKTVARRLENMTSEGSQDNGMYSAPNQRKNRWDFD